MRRFRALVFGSLISLSAFPVGTGITPACAQDVTGSLFAQGMKLYAARDYSGAVDYLGQVCDLAPQHQQAHFYLAYSLVGLQKLDKALKQAEHLVVLDPSNTQYRQLREQIAQQLAATRPVGPGPGSAPRPGVPPKEVVIGDYESVAREPAVKPPPKSTAPKPVKKTRTALDTAIDELDLGNFDAAAKQIDAIIKSEPKNSTAFHYRGLVEAQQGRFAEAIPFFEKALGIQANLYDTLFLLGDAQLRTGKTKEAEATFEKAVALKQDVFALINLAEAKKKNGKLKDALELFRKALKIDGNSVEAKLNLAEATAEEGKPEEAMNLINDVLAADNTNGTAHFIKGKILSRSDLTDDAIAEMRLAIKASPDNEFFSYELAKVLIRAGKTVEVLDLGNNLLRSSPNAAEPRLLIAEALIAGGDFPSAEEQLEPIKDRKLPRMDLLKARIERRSGSKERAVELYRAYLAEEPNDGDVLFELAGHFEENGDAESATDFYAEVVKRFPGTGLATQADEKLRVLESAKSSSTQSSAPEAPKVEPGNVKY